MISENDIIKICKEYNIQVSEINNFIDSSKGEDDIRYNYVINNKFVLKMNTNGVITEKTLMEIDALQNRYRSIGVYCPRIYKTRECNYLYLYSKDSTDYQCYIEEYAPYKTARDVIDTYEGKLKMLGHLGRLAALYTNVDLVETHSMWSIIDLAPLDENIDEKQGNLNSLVESLNNRSFNVLADRLVTINEEMREIIKSNFASLPRCVYQGDLNPSNVLVDDKGDFIGIIDFNLFGTEVNINCFLNECMYYLEEKDFETLSALEIYNKMNDMQAKLLNKILEYYELNDVENKCFNAYKMIIDISFYPNVEIMKYCLEENKEVEKVIELITLMIDDK